MQNIKSINNDNFSYQITLKKYEEIVDFLKILKDRPRPEILVAFWERLARFYHTQRREMLSIALYRLKRAQSKKSAFVMFNHNAVDRCRKMLEGYYRWQARTYNVYFKGNTEMADHLLSILTPTAAAFIISRPQFFEGDRLRVETLKIKYYDILSVIFKKGFYNPDLRPCLLYSDPCTGFYTAVPCRHAEAKRGKSINPFEWDLAPFHIQQNSRNYLRMLSAQKFAARNNLDIVDVIYLKN